MSDDDFFDLDKPIDSVTVQELDQLGKLIFEQRQTAEESERKAKEENKRLEMLYNKMLSILERFGRTNYEVPGLGRLTAVERSFVSLPKTPEDKDTFYSYLKDQGIFDELISVNSNTLNAFYKRELEIAREEGRAFGFKIPGISEPITSMTLRVMKKGK
jgi:hypothetical protein